MLSFKALGFYLGDTWDKSVKKDVNSRRKRE